MRNFINISDLSKNELRAIINGAKKRKAEKNPWGEGATTLEWTVTSPPPFHTFEELPKVK